MKTLALISAIIATSIACLYAPFFGSFLGGLVVLGLILEAIEKVGVKCKS